MVNPKTVVTSSCSIGPRLDRVRSTDATSRFGVVAYVTRCNRAASKPSHVRYVAAESGSAYWRTAVPSGACKGTPQPKTDDLTTEIRGLLDRLEASLVSRLDARDLGTRLHLPFYALYCRETWMWRVVELGRDAFDCFQKEDFVSAMVLTRAAMETTAALWVLRGKLKKALKLGSVNISELGRYLARLRVGQGKGIAQPDDPIAVHVMDFIRAVEKDCEGFEHQYDRLSEFAHPNWSGTTGLYSRFDHDKALSEFGRNIRGGEGTKGIGLTNLSVALIFFEHIYNCSPT